MPILFYVGRAAEGNKNAETYNSVIFPLSFFCVTSGFFCAFYVLTHRHRPFAHFIFIAFCVIAIIIGIGLKYVLLLHSISDMNWNNQLIENRSFFRFAFVQTPLAHLILSHCGQYHSHFMDFMGLRFEFGVNKNRWKRKIKFEFWISLYEILS